MSTLARRFIGGVLFVVFVILAVHNMYLIDLRHKIRVLEKSVQPVEQVEQVK